MHHTHVSHTPSSSTSPSHLALAFFLTAGFMGIEAVAGWISGSLALLADAGHMLTDAASLGIAWGAILFGKKTADHARSFGYRRVEVLAAWINGLSLVAIAFFICIEAVRRFMVPVAIEPRIMLGTAVIGLFVNIIAFRILHAGQNNINVKAALMHVAGDILGSLAAIAAAIVISLTGFMAIDPILSLLVAAIIGWSAWDILKRTTHILLEGSPDGFNPAPIAKRLVDAVPGIAGVHHVHAWSITPETPILTLHVRLCEGGDMQESLAAAKHILEHEFGFAHTVIQPETQDCMETRCVADLSA
ncbi:MAG TPA: cation transporter [Rhodospirillaceae bacterium]|nr:MAG: hypothetical protein A2018_03530 [Alphaproteobacteria bacterium GWF2_58_20]HAU29639.1 cation transporter [Rhodospirillaceae bacterium]